MAAVDEAQKLLRQQIVFSRQLLGFVDGADTRVAELAAIQACLLCLNLGVVGYVNALLGLSSGSSLRDCERALGQFDAHGQEVLNLLRSDGSWLFRFRQVLESLNHLPRSLGGMAMALTAKEGANVIIRTTAEPDPIHWGALDRAYVHAVIEELSSLLDRHCDSAQEY